MNTRWICPLLIATAFFGANEVQAQEQTKKLPNVVFFLVDDLGWADPGCYGSEFHETPNIDALAESGMRFTNGYAAASICSPTRASIMTGRHPVRVDITDWIEGFNWRRAKNPKLITPDDRSNLALEEVTIAETLKDHGYQTFFAGKWHLGGEGHYPTDQGFDINIGGHHVGSPPGGYYGPWKNPLLTADFEGEYLTDRLTDESLKFLDERDADRPFLLYLSYYNVHTPIQPCKEFIEHFEAKKTAMYGDEQTPTRVEHDGLTRMRQDNAPFASMLRAVDKSVGRVLEKLDELNLAEDTLVVFFSDNGGLSTLRTFGPTCNEPLRAGKGWLYEGGIREPMIVRAPGVTEPGSTCDAPVISMDFFPTILELAGLPAQPELHADGKSLVPLLAGIKTVDNERILCWHYPHYHGSTWAPGAAIRQGDWKLVEFYHYGNVELYNLKDDPSEKNDLSETMPEKTREMLDKLHAWQKDLNAQMPKLNPDYVE